MAMLSLEDVMRIAEIWEKEGNISTSAVVGRVLLKAVKDLTDEVIDLKLELKESQND